jgi:CheY-like chemotaxis protein
MTGKRVLVVHRSAAVRDRFARTLADSGHAAAAIATSSDLADALRTPDEIDLALLDASMAREASDTLLVHPRASRQRPTVVVFGSTVADATQARELAAAGVDAYINDFSSPQQILSNLAPYLFHDNFDRRASPRVPVAMGVSCRVGSLVSAATALNIGRGGIALRTLAPVPAGSSVTLRFRLPGVAHDLDVDARVCWTDSHLGLGAQFERISPEDQQALDVYVERHLAERERE